MPIDGRIMVASLVAAVRPMLIVDTQTITIIIIATDDRRIEEGAL